MNNEACGYWKKNGEYMYLLIQGDPYLKNVSRTHLLNMDHPVGIV